MGLKPKAIARVGDRMVVIPFPTGDEVAVAPPLPTLPHEPTGVTASAGLFDVSVAISWTDASTNETGFYVYRNTSNTTTGATLIATRAAGSTAYTDNAANSGANAPAQGTTYYYWVSSYNLAGESAKSPAASNGTGGVATIWLVPAAPTSLSATAVSSSQINLAWTDNSNNETGFEIFRSTDGIVFSSLATVGAGVTTYNNTGLTASTQYYYRVKAFNPGESSLDSNTANATTQAGSGIPAATFDMNFTTSPYVGAGGRFTRASRGTFVNSAGYIQTAEMNLAINSEDMSLWSGVASTVTVNAITAPDGSLTADRIVETTATERHARYLGIALSTANVPHTVSFYVKKDTRRYVHAQFNIGGGRYGAIWDLDTGSVSATLSSGGFTNTSSTITAVGNGWHRVTLTGTFNGTSSNVLFGTSDRADFTGTLVAESPSFAGSTTEGMYVWGVQVVQSSSALPYVRTTTIAVGTPRITHDPVTLAPLGLLLEPAATNLCLNSETAEAATGVAVTVNTTTSPANTLTADTLTETAGTGFHHGIKTFTLTAGTRYTASVFVKNPAGSRNGFFYMTVDFGGGTATGYGATFDIANGTLGGAGSTASRGNPSGSHGIENYGNGWYRIWVAATSDATNTNAQIYYGGTPSMTPTWFANYIQYTVTAGDEKSIANVWGFQIETGSTATSYIPTTTATVTRSGDGWGILSAEMPSIWNQSQGSLVAKGRMYTPLTNAGLVRAGVASSNINGYFTSTASSGGTRPAIRVSSVNYNSGPTGTPANGAVINTGYSYNQATPAFTGFVGGTAGSTLTNSLSGVTVDKLEVGTRIESNMAGSTTLSPPHSVFVIERMRYWNTALSNADMQTATT